MQSKNPQLNKVIEKINQRNREIKEAKIPSAEDIVNQLNKKKKVEVSEETLEVLEQARRPEFTEEEIDLALKEIYLKEK